MTPIFAPKQGMLLLRSMEELARVPGPVALAIGVFDGLHLGHQEVIDAALEHAKQHRGQAVVMSFDPHPMQVLRPESAPRRLCGWSYQNYLLGKMGVAGVLICPFTRDFAAMPAQSFVEALVRQCQPLGCISVGYAWSFGRNRDGNIHALMDFGQQHDFAVYGVPPIRVEGEVVSSTLIRDAVVAGDLARAARLLGRPYGLFGRVQEGQRLAREWGFATANLRPDAELLPDYGVYAVEVDVDGQWLPGVANLGVRPTLDATDSVPLLETHVFDWQGDLYGRDLEVRLLHFIRDERRFANLEALRAQIDEDARQARSLLGA